MELPIDRTYALKLGFGSDNMAEFHPTKFLLIRIRIRGFMVDMIRNDSDQIRIMGLEAQLKDTQGLEVCPAEPTAKLPVS